MIFEQERSQKYQALFLKVSDVLKSNKQSYSQQKRERISGDPREGRKNNGSQEDRISGPAPVSVSRVWFRMGSQIAPKDILNSAGAKKIMKPASGIKIVTDRFLQCFKTTDGLQGHHKNSISNQDSARFPNGRAFFSTNPLRECATVFALFCNFHGRCSRRCRNLNNLLAIFRMDHHRVRL